MARSISPTGDQFLFPKKDEPGHRSNFEALERWLNSHIVTRITNSTSSQPVQGRPGTGAVTVPTSGSGSITSSMVLEMGTGGNTIQPTMYANAVPDTSGGYRCTLSSSFFVHAGSVVVELDDVIILPKPSGAGPTVTYAYVYVSDLTGVNTLNMHYTIGGTMTDQGASGLGEVYGFTPGSWVTPTITGADLGTAFGGGSGTILKVTSVAAGGAGIFYAWVVTVDIQP